jgi:hypothetical protein
MPKDAIEVAELALGVGVGRRWFGGVLVDEREQHAHGGRRGHCWTSAGDRGATPRRRSREPAAGALLGLA